MKPFVSIILPVRDRVELARRAVLALHAQTADLDAFEVVIAVDGLDMVESVLDEIEPELQPFTCTVVGSPRTEGREDLPHRNHARNAGCRAARGEYLWPVDGDMLADPVAVEHLHALTIRAPRPLVVSPCLAQPRCTPAEWLKLTPATTADGLLGQRLTFELDACTSSGRVDLYRPGAPSWVHLAKLNEGVPAFPRRFWSALGGFDERFIGYGGNKISFCRALRQLDAKHGRLEYGLLNSCLFLHQPHAPDPLRGNATHRVRNWKLLHRYAEDMRGRARWWRNVLTELR